MITDNVCELLSQFEQTNKTDETIITYNGKSLCISDEILRDLEENHNKRLTVKELKDMLTQL